MFSTGGTSRVESRAATDRDYYLFRASDHGGDRFCRDRRVAGSSAPHGARVVRDHLRGSSTPGNGPPHGRRHSLTRLTQRDSHRGDWRRSPVSYPVRVAISATGDADTSDTSSAEYNVQITPFADAGADAHQRSAVRVSRPGFTSSRRDSGRSCHATCSQREFLCSPTRVSCRLITAPAAHGLRVTQRSVDNRYDTLLCQIWHWFPPIPDRLLQFRRGGLSAGDGGRATAARPGRPGRATSTGTQQCLGCSGPGGRGFSTWRSNWQAHRPPRAWEPAWRVAAYYSAAQPRQRTTHHPESRSRGIRVHQVGFFRLGMPGATTLECGPVVLDAGNGNQLRYHSSIRSRPARLRAKVAVTAVSDTRCREQYGWTLQ